MSNIETFTSSNKHCQWGFRWTLYEEFCVLQDNSVTRTIIAHSSQNYEQSTISIRIHKWINFSCHKITHTGQAHPHTWEKKSSVKVLYIPSPLVSRGLAGGILRDILCLSARIPSATLRGRYQGDLFLSILAESLNPYNTNLKHLSTCYPRTEKRLNHTTATT